MTGEIWCFALAAGYLSFCAILAFCFFVLLWRMESNDARLVEQQNLQGAHPLQEENDG
jgi:hypothetical protein